jgi:hypothetical protein
MMDILTLIGLVCKRSQQERFSYPYFVALRLLVFFFNNSEEIFVSRIITKTNYFRPKPKDMDYSYYLDVFQKAADQLDKKLFRDKQLEVSTGLILDSVFLKVYKKTWTSDRQDPMNATTRIFFSVWVNDKTIAAQKIFYNIHAFKLRELRGYSISSRDFAKDFRDRFEEAQHNWKNVSVAFGPLTLMEGWETLETDAPENIISGLAGNFLPIAELIDKTLEKFENK